LRAEIELLVIGCDARFDDIAVAQTPTGEDAPSGPPGFSERGRMRVASGAPLLVLAALASSSSLKRSCTTKKYGMRPLLHLICS